jgi:hypothetical protein
MQESGRTIRSALEWLMSDDRVSAKHSCQTAEPFSGDGIPLVRHGRAAFLAFSKILLDLQDLGALQMAELRRPPVNTRRD